MRHHRQPGCHLRLGLATLLLVGLAPAVPAGAAASPTRSATTPLPLAARLVAVGVPGAGAIASVGTFLPGGPIHDLNTPAQPFAPTTLPGQILDPARIVVASTSNFGVPALPQTTGAILSIDPGGAPLLIPPTFARAGGQASAAGGRVRLFTASSAAFLNGIHTPQALTASEPAVSNPLGISINNAFGRLWFANAPTGLSGPGTSTVIDPTGLPLFGAPSATAGGVFFGQLTNRATFTSLSRGLLAGTVGTALLGPSPDGTTANNAAKTPRVVFATVTADGAVQQVHVEKGVNELAAPGTITPLNGRTANPGRLGVVWDGMCLFITDPIANRVVVLMLAADPVSPSALFHTTFIGQIPAPAGVLATPVDLAPTQPETHSTTLASNTSLASGSDLYVANWANNTIVRLNEHGTVLGVRQVTLPGPNDLLAVSWHLSGIGVSSDATRIWATVRLTTALGLEDGLVLELPAF